VVGDVIANLLLKTGFDVQREYYINDGGGQAETLAKSTYLRYKEALGENIGQIPEGFYPGEYLKAVGQALAKEYGHKFLEKPEGEFLEEIMVFAVNFLMDEIKETLGKYGITDMVFRSENALVKNGAVDDAIENLRKKGLVYTGILDAPKGVEVDEWEAKEQLIFKASEFGDDVDRPLKRSDGSWTYFAKDLAYHYDKYMRGFKEQIDILGADHGGYVKRIVAGLKALTDEKASLEVRICQMVNFMDNGQPVKMSKRAGTFVTLEDIIDSVGKDVARFVMLTRKNDAHIELDYAKVKEQSKDNPVFYVQYAHARCHSVFRQAKEVFPDMHPSSQLDFEAFSKLSPDEIHLLWFIGQFPACIEQAALLKEPHRVVYYLYDLAALFHSLWNKGKEDALLRFILPQDPTTTFGRICLISALQSTLQNGLAVLGVKALEEMR
jgi:arginyl-tRNA synthetase